MLRLLLVLVVATITLPQSTAHARVDYSKCEEIRGRLQFALDMYSAYVERSLKDLSDRDADKQAKIALDSAVKWATIYNSILSLIHI